MTLITKWTPILQPFLAPYVSLHDALCLQRPHPLTIWICHDFNYHKNEREYPKTCLTNHKGSIAHLPLHGFPPPPISTPMYNHLLLSMMWVCLLACVCPPPRLLITSGVIYIHTCMCTYMHTYKTYVHIYIHINVCMYVCAYIYVYYVQI